MHFAGGCMEEIVGPKINRGVAGLWHVLTADFNILESDGHFFVIIVGETIFGVYYWHPLRFTALPKGADGIRTGTALRQFFGIEGHASGLLRHDTRPLDGCFVSGAIILAIYVEAADILIPGLVVLIIPKQIM